MGEEKLSCLSEYNAQGEATMKLAILPTLLGSACLCTAVVDAYPWRKEGIRHVLK